MLCCGAGIENLCTRSVGILSIISQGKNFALLTESQAAMARIQIPGQAAAARIIGLASALYQHNSTVTVLWVSGHRGVEGSRRHRWTGRRDLPVRQRIYHQVPGQCGPPQGAASEGGVRGVGGGDSSEKGRGQSHPPT